MNDEERLDEYVKLCLIVLNTFGLSEYLYNNVIPRQSSLHKKESIGIHNQGSLLGNTGHTETEFSVFKKLKLSGCLKTIFLVGIRIAQLVLTRNKPYIQNHRISCSISLLGTRDVTHKPCRIFQFTAQSIMYLMALNVRIKASEQGLHQCQKISSTLVVAVTFDC